MYNLWIYNHIFPAISDQIEFFVKIFQNYGFHVSVSKKPQINSINFVIENFSLKHDRDRLISFCKKTNKKVCLIMTEHIDFIGNNMFFYGKKLYRNNDYMSQKTKIQRIMGLIECAPFFSSIVTLGDLPQLLGIELFLPDVPVIRLPFPKLSFIEKNNYTPQYDFLFIGALTKYRRDFIKNLFRGGFNICYPNYQRNFFISRKLRNDYIHKSKIILNVPQVRDWPWLSLMRVIVALANGKATLSVNTQDSSQIHSCVYQTKSFFLFEKLNIYELINNWFLLYKKSYYYYISTIKKYNSINKFPLKFFNWWINREL